MSLLGQEIFQSARQIATTWNAVACCTYLGSLCVKQIRQLSLGYSDTIFQVPYDFVSAGCEAIRMVHMPLHEVDEISSRIMDQRRRVTVAGRCREVWRCVLALRRPPDRGCDYLQPSSDLCACVPSGPFKIPHARPPPPLRSFPLSFLLPHNHLDDSGLALRHQH